MTETSKVNLVPADNGRTAGIAHRFSNLIAGTLAIIWSGLALAQQDDPSNNWYQVEVIIFERLAPSRMEDPEIWPKDINLDYPANWRKLIDAETAAEWLKLDAEILADSEYGSDQPTPAGDTGSGAIGSSDPGTAPPSADALASQQGAPQAAFEQQADDTTPEVIRPPLLQRGEHKEYAFVRLGREARTLNESSGAISRDRGMRVLFHEAWRQPLNSGSDAPSIIVRGGNEYGEHTELEGTLHLSISRYLHMQSNLWLTQFIPNYGQESEHWPALPELPSRQPIEPQAGSADTDLLLGETETAWDIKPQLPEDYTALIDQPFLVKEIVTLKQARRMRSGELHYIDHPRIGILVKIDTYEPEVEETDSSSRGN